MGRKTKIKASDVPAEILEKWGDRWEVSAERIRLALDRLITTYGLDGMYLKNRSGKWAESLDTFERELLGQCLDELDMEEYVQSPHHKVSLTIEVDLPCEMDQDALKLLLRKTLTRFTEETYQGPYQFAHCARQISKALDATPQEGT